MGQKKKSLVATAGRMRFVTRYLARLLALNAERAREERLAGRDV